MDSMERETQTLERAVLKTKVDKIPYATQMSAGLQRGVYEDARELAKEYNSAPAFQAHWRYNPETNEGNGSNLFWLVLANKFLAKKGLRTLTTSEVRQIDKRKLFSNRVYRDFEGVIYSPENPNSDIAQVLVPEAQRRNLELPVIVHPLSLDVRKSQNQHGVEFTFNDNNLFVVGEEAREIIKGFAYRANSGVHRLGRDRGGSWGASWGNLANSDEHGRVDWVRAEGTRADFENDTISVVETAAQEELQRYVTELEQRKAEALKLVRGKK